VFLDHCGKLFMMIEKLIKRSQFKGWINECADEQRLVRISAGK